MPNALDEANVIRGITQFLRRYFDRNGYAPTYREIAEAVGVSSTSTIHHLIDVMIQDGAVTMVRGKSRTLRLVDDGQDAGGLSGRRGT